MIVQKHFKVTQVDGDAVVNVLRQVECDPILCRFMNLHGLAEKHACIGQVRGKGLFCGLELVKDRETREPADEAMVAAVLKDCMGQGVIIGATNRSFPGYNNTLCFSPALIATPEDIDAITDAVDQALTRVFG